MTVTLQEVVLATEAHWAAVPGELAGYLLLGALEQLAAVPRAVGLGEIALDPAGSVHVVGGTTCAESIAESELRGVFRVLLARANPVTPALTRVAARPSGAGVSALLRELEAALIPVNRSAGRRAIARLYRETAQALAAGDLRAEPEPVKPPETAASETPACSTRVPSPGSDPAPQLAVEEREPTIALTPTRPEPIVARASQRPTGDVPQPSRDMPAMHEHVDATERMPPVSPDEAAEPGAIDDDDETDWVCVEQDSEDDEPEPELTCSAPEPSAEAECTGEEPIRSDPESVEEAPPCVEPEQAELPVPAAECFVPWESSTPPGALAADESPLAADESPLAADEPPLATPDSLSHDAAPPSSSSAVRDREASEDWESLEQLDAHWDPSRPPPEVSESPLPLDAARVVLELDPITLTAPGLGRVEEREPTPQRPVSEAAPPPAYRAPPRFLPRKSDVEALLHGFVVGEARSESELCRELSEIAGVEPAPPLDERGLAKTG